MGFMDKLMFWKHNDDFAIPEGPKPDFGAGMDAGLPQGNNLGLSAPVSEPGFPGSFEEPRPSFGQNPVASPFQAQQAAPFQQPSQPQQSTNDYMVSKNIEVLSSKLDALRVGIESINQRLAHLEKIASGDHDERRRAW